MPIKTTTVTRREIKNIERLNAELREKKARIERIPGGGVITYEGSKNKREAPAGAIVCDACQKRIKDRCWNVVVGNEGADLRVGEPRQDERFVVTLRYHDGCYPSKLIENLNDAAGTSRGQVVRELGGQ